MSSDREFGTNGWYFKFYGRNFPFLEAMAKIDELTSEKNGEYSSAVHAQAETLSTI